MILGVCHHSTLSSLNLHFTSPEKKEKIQKLEVSTATATPEDFERARQKAVELELNLENRSFSRECKAVYSVFYKENKLMIPNERSIFQIEL